jgi:uncharacterized C2H2 Zn-finger protein
MKHSCSKVDLRRIVITLINIWRQKYHATWKFNLKETPKTELVVSVLLCKSQAALLRHEGIVGVHPLQCPTCKTVFKNACAKCRHMQKVGVKLVRLAMLMHPIKLRYTWTIWKQQRILTTTIRRLWTLLVHLNRKCAATIHGRHRGGR